MIDAEVEVTRDVIGDIAPQIFGGLLEHLGRCVYGGVWDLQSQRLRPDVLRAMRALAPASLWWPGGCFSAWYRWRDGVGPRDERPTRDRQFWTDNSAHRARAAGHDEGESTAALGPPETHAFGTDEFLEYCVAIGAEPFLVVNLGDGEPRGTGRPRKRRVGRAFAIESGGRRAGSSGEGSATRRGARSSRATVRRSTTRRVCVSSRTPCGPRTP